MLEGVRAVQASSHVEASSPRGWLARAQALARACHARLPKLCVRHEFGEHPCEVKTLCKVNALTIDTHAVDGISYH